MKIICVMAILFLSACTAKQVTGEHRVPAATAGDLNIFPIETAKGAGNGILEEICSGNDGKIVKNKDRAHEQLICVGGRYDRHEIGTYLNDDCQARYNEAKSLLEENAGNDEVIYTRASVTLSACVNYAENQNFSGVGPQLQSAFKICRKNSSQVSQVWTANCFLKAAEFGITVMRPIR